MVAPGRLLQALLDCCSDAPGAAAAAAQADAALSPAQREVRRLLAEAAELEAENPARKTHDHCWHPARIRPRVSATIVRTGAAEVYAAAYKLEPDFAERELYGDPQLQAEQQQQFVARFLAAVKANA